MFAWILQMIIISITFIFLVHHLIYFFKSMLTVTKIKDLVDSPSQKYKNIFDTISKQSNNYNNNTTTNISSLNVESLLPKESNMKSELKMFLKKQLNTDSSNDIVNYSF
jgi:hypothetical protein